MSEGPLGSTSAWPGPHSGTRLVVPLAYLGVTAAITAVIAAGHLEMLALLLGCAVAIAVAYRFPVPTIAAHVAVSVLPLMLQMTPWSEVTAVALFRVPVQVLVLLPMTGAVAVRVAVLLATRRRIVLPRFLPLTIALGSLLALLFLVGVIMGFTARPLSALREFAVSYLGLVVVPYIALFVRTRREIARLFKGIALVGVGVPLVLLPLVGALKGWGIGPETRFYPSAVHMGILYGAVGLWLLSPRERAWRSVLVVVMSLAVMLIVADSHRSVWLAAGVSLLVLAVAGRVRLDRFWKWGFIAVLVALVAGAVFTALGEDPIEYIAARSVAFTDPAADATAAWRLALWEAAIEEGREHLVLGEGFGSYYDFETRYGNITVSPHSLYVQTFLKLGLTGLVTYVALAAALIASLGSSRRRMTRHQDRQFEPVLVMGLVAACASLAYGLVYAFDPYSMLFIGLGLAAALKSSDRTLATSVA